MGRGYRPEEIRQRLIEALADSGIGMSGVEISERLGLNRSTMTKYLEIFAAAGLLRRKEIGNLTLWSLESDQTSYEFPADYFRLAPEFLDRLLRYSGDAACSLIRNCLHSGATAGMLVSEIIVPAAASVDESFEAGKIGSSEQKCLQSIISGSLHVINQVPAEPDPGKAALVMSADPQSGILSEAAATVLRSENWSVFHLGDMSSAANLLFDLDLQKLLGKIPRQKSGIVAAVVFSGTEEGLHFFSDAVRNLRQKSKRPIRLVLCGRIGKKTKLEHDFLSADFADIMQWSRTASAGLK